jgi:hypothetical protein
VRHAAGGRVLAGLAGLALLAGCGGGGAAAAPTTPTAPAPAAVSRTSGGVRLVVQGFHVFPLQEVDAAARSTATALGVPVAAVGQMHLVLTIANTTGSPRSVAADTLTLDLGGHALPPVTTGVFPTEPLQPGSQHDTAVGFDVAATSGGAAPALRWTHDGTVTVVPVGGAPELD